MNTLVRTYNEVLGLPLCVVERKSMRIDRSPKKQPARLRNGSPTFQTYRITRHPEAGVISVEYV